MRGVILRLGWLACTLLAGCSIGQPYPGAWPRVDPTRRTGCPPVAGDYLSDGVRGDPFAAPSSLSRLVFDRSVPGAIIRIQQNGADSLVVTAWKGAVAVADRVFSRAGGNLECAREGVELSCGWRYAPMAFAPGDARRTLYLARAMDGSLMVQEVNWYIAFVMLIPVPFPGTMRSWHRFSPPTFPLILAPEGESPVTE